MNAEDAVRIVAIGLAVYGVNYWRGRHDRKKDKELQEKFRNRTPEQFVHKVLSTKTSASEKIVDRPEWIKSNNEKAVFNKLSKADQIKKDDEDFRSIFGIPPDK